MEILKFENEEVKVGMLDDLVQKSWILTGVDSEFGLYWKCMNKSLNLIQEGSQKMK